MGLHIVSFEPTPNPNALKLLVEPDAGDRPRSYFSPAEAAGDPLAEALFGIDGVTNVLIHTRFITLCKAPEAPWGPIRRAAREVLEAAAP
ncbi:MAG: NifU N-terminal domain-containing protein [Phycisphaerales bacterium JB039]